jgi:toxin secretion/phage lysis holin
MTQPVLKLLYTYVGLSKAAKIAVAGLMAITLEGVIKALGSFFNTYIFDDWASLPYIVVLVFIDTALGFYRAWHLKRISSKGFSKVLSKLVTYSILLITSHVLAEFTVRGERVLLLEWFSAAVYPFMIVREALSLIEHLALLGWVKIPNEIKARLEKFTDDGHPLPNSPQSPK